MSKIRTKIAGIFSIYYFNLRKSFQAFSKMLQLIFKIYNDFKFQGRMNTFVDHYYRIYSARKWTFEHLFCLFIYFIIFALPFYFSFASKNFWFDEQFSKMSLKYSFTGFYAAQLTYLDSTNTSNLKQLLIAPSSTLKSLTQLDTTISDNPTSSSFQFTIIFNNLSPPVSKITNLNIILYYDVEVLQLQRTVSVGFPYTFKGSGVVDVTAKLKLRVQQPFNGITLKTSPTINKPAYFDSQFYSPTSFSSLIDAHLANPYKLQAQSYWQQTPSSSTTSITYSLSLLKDTSIVLPYYPSILQTLKLKFSTYFGMLLLSYLIFQQLLRMLVRYEALECNQRDQVPHHLHQLPQHQKQPNYGKNKQVA